MTVKFAYDLIASRTVRPSNLQLWTWDKLHNDLHRQNIARLLVTPKRTHTGCTANCTVSVHPFRERMWPSMVIQHLANYICIFMSNAPISILRMVWPGCARSIDMHCLLICFVNVNPPTRPTPAPPKRPDDRRNERPDGRSWFIFVFFRERVGGFRDWQFIGRPFPRKYPDYGRPFGGDIPGRRGLPSVGRTTAELISATNRRRQFK